MTLKYQAVYNSPLLEWCPQDGVFYSSWPDRPFSFGTKRNKSVG